MSPEELVAEMLERMNRPDDDDLFEFPQSYYGALTQAKRKLRRKIARSRSEILYTTDIFTSSDGGTTFTLSDDHLGELVLFRDPGPGKVKPFIPGLPEGSGHYYIDKRTIKFLSPYSGTLHVRWVPAATVAINDSVTDSGLPVYCDDFLIWEACGIMAGTPGFMGDRSYFEGKAIQEWKGDPRDESDEGILGILKNQDAYQGMESSGYDDDRWWVGIGGA